MNVRDLIEALKNADPLAEVQIPGCHHHGCWNEVENAYQATEQRGLVTPNPIDASVFRLEGSGY